MSKAGWAFQSSLGLFDITQHFTNAQSRSPSSDEQGWIEIRFEERQLPDLSPDIHAVADLEEPVGHRGPVAEQLVVALNTVKRHTSNIFEKLGASNRTQAVAQARAFWLLDE